MKIKLFLILGIIALVLVFIGCDELTEATALTAPTNVRAVAGYRSVTLTWTASSDEAVTGYEIRWTVDGSVYRDYVTGRENTTHTVTEDLKTGKVHHFAITALAGSVRSASSDYVTAIPKELPAPTGFTATADTNSVRLTWTASSDETVTGYKIRQTVEGTTTTIAVAGRSTASHTVTGLTAEKSYSFTIAAVAGSVESVQSEAKTATPTAIPPTNEPAQQPTAPTPPTNEPAQQPTAIPPTNEPAQQPTPPTGVPTNVRAVEGYRSVTLTWDAVDGAERYLIYRDGERFTNEKNTIYSAIFYDEVTTNSYTVSAVIDGVESAQSTAVTATPTTTTPTTPTPTGLTVTGTTSTSLTLSWEAVEGAEWYLIYRADTSIPYSHNTSTNTSTTHRVKGLTAGIEYSFTILVVVKSSEGAKSISARSAPVTATPTNVPPAPTGGLTVTGTTSTSVTLTWTASRDETVTEYKIYQDSNETPIHTVSGRENTTYTITGLTVWKIYSFTIAAVSGSAESAQSTAVTAIPTGLRVTGTTSNSVILTWTAYSNTAVTGYKIRQTVDGNTTTIAVSGRSTASHTVTGLTAGKEYSFTIVAVTEFAESVQSEAVKVTPR